MRHLAKEAADQPTTAIAPLSMGRLMVDIGCQSVGAGVKHHYSAQAPQECG